MRWSFIVAGLLLAAPALADKCLNAQTQMDMNVCAANDEAKADAMLNKTYAELAKSLDSTDLPDLKLAETAWIKYRDAQCNFEGGIYEGGSIQPMIISDCLTALTKAQTQRLKDRLPQ